MVVSYNNNIPSNTTILSTKQLTSEQLLLFTSRNIMLATHKLISRCLRNIASPNSRRLIVAGSNRLLADENQEAVSQTNNSQSPELIANQDDLATQYNLLDKRDFFGLKNLFTVEDLLNARVHFGHKEGTLHGHMRPYIFGKRLGVLIFDLDKTAKLLEQALNVTAEIAYREGIILFMHSSRETGYLVEKAAKECGEYAHCRRWRQAVLANSRQVFGSVTRLPDLIVMFSIMDMVKGDPHTAVTVSAKMLIPTVGICDTNSNPSLITYPVPGNDDSPASIELYCQLFKEAVLKGKAKRNEIIEKYGEDFYIKTLEFTEDKQQ